MIFGVVLAYFGALIWVVLAMVGIFGWLWVVEGSGEYILGSGCWLWVVVGLFWIVVGRGVFAMVVYFFEK